MELRRVFKDIQGGQQTVIQERTQGNSMITQLVNNLETLSRISTNIHPKLVDYAGLVIWGPGTSIFKGRTTLH